MILPQKNAYLLRVSRGGSSEDYDSASEDYDSPAAEDVTPTGAADVWTGRVDALFGRRRATLTEGSLLNRTTIQYVVVPGDLGIDFALGDIVTIEQNGVSFQRKVHDYRDRELDFAVPMPIRLDLEEE